MKRSEQVWEETHQQISEVLRKYKEQSDRHRGTTPQYQPGDRVWLSTRDLRFEGACRKLLPSLLSQVRLPRVFLMTCRPRQWRGRIRLPMRFERCWIHAGVAVCSSTSLTGWVTALRSVAGLPPVTCWILLYWPNFMPVTLGNLLPDPVGVPSAHSLLRLRCVGVPSLATPACPAPLWLRLVLPPVLPAHWVDVVVVVPVPAPFRLPWGEVLSRLVLLAPLSLPHPALTEVLRSTTTLPRMHHPLTSRTHLVT
ncbi:uncharacterized protein LOC125784455 [Astyanax mexicanus]|uniref:uncharacterized protein LOC125784455 n=1 Tax=Astyanax mexicanus TaxID=7994 RepID=UPI0020CB1D39|nr:uncharacterized protein LOC125784455 [Astyanax mexicanus]